MSVNLKAPAWVLPLARGRCHGVEGASETVVWVEELGVVEARLCRQCGWRWKLMSGDGVLLGEMTGCRLVGLLRPGRRPLERWTHAGGGDVAPE